VTPTLRTVLLTVGIAAICAAVTGCSLLSPSKIKVEKAMLDQIPLDLPHRESRSDTVLVFPPQTAPVYDTKQMAYRTRAHEVAYFSEREWGETPAQMLHPLLVKALDNTRAFGAVLVPPYTGRYGRALRTEILELIQDFTSQPAILVLTLKFQLTDYEMKQVIATKEVSVREPMQERSSYGGVVAANEATADALRQMAEFVSEAASSSGCRPSS
jgi:cholesterol transport system auxiliary component